MFGGRRGGSAAGFGGFPGFDFGAGAGANGGRPFTAEDIFGFGQASTGATGSTGSQPGGDILARLSIPFMDAVKGTRRTVSYVAWSRCTPCDGVGLKRGAKPKRCSTCGGTGERLFSQGGYRILTTCPTCNGQGSHVSPSDHCSSCRGEGRVQERKEAVIAVPAGVDTGERLRVVGRGHAGVGEQGAAGRAGDLYVVLQVQSPGPNESMFKRNGADVTVEVGNVCARAC